MATIGHLRIPSSNLIVQTATLSQHTVLLVNTLGKGEMEPHQSIHSLLTEKEAMPPSSVTIALAGPLQITH